MSNRPAHRVCAALLAALATACAPGAQRGQQPFPAPAPGELLDSARFAVLPAQQRTDWMHYLATSDRSRHADRAAIEAELQASGQERWVPAPAGPSLVVDQTMTADWFRSGEALRIADNILSFQTPSGGWSKRVDVRLRPRQPGESYSAERGWSYIGTFDNDATTEHVRFLALAYGALGDERYRHGFRRGLDYIFRAQFPNGCWPQVFPLQGSYHDAVTYNDEAMVNILQLLKDVAGGEIPSVEPAERRAAEASLQKGIRCVLASQVVVDGVKTVWGAQHDPLTLLPVQARAYEHAALSGGESVGIMELLMRIESPDAPVVEAVHAAAAWFRHTAIFGYDYELSAGLTAREGAGPIWARFYEIGTNRPIFSGRDGVIRYHWHELEEERRFGYAWYRNSAARALRTCDRWAARPDVAG